MDKSARLPAMARVAKVYEVGRGFRVLLRCSCRRTHGNPRLRTGPIRQRWNGWGLNKKSSGQVACGGGAWPLQCCAQALFCHPPIPLCAGNYSMHQACVGDAAAAASPHLSAPTRFSVHHMVPTSTSMSVVLPRTNSSPRLAPLALLFPLVSAMAGCTRRKTFSGGTERGSRGEGRGGARTKTTKSSRDGAVEAPRRPPVRSPKQRLPQTGSSLCLLRRARHPLRCPPKGGPAANSHRNT